MIDEFDWWKDETHWADDWGWLCETEKVLGSRNRAINTERNGEKAQAWVKVMLEKKSKGLLAELTGINMS